MTITITAAGSFDEAKHPRVATGPQGGEWTSGDGAADSSDDQGAKDAYAALLKMSPADRAKALAAMSPDMLKRVGAFAAIGGSSDPDIAQIRNAVGDTMKAKGIDPGSVGLKAKGTAKGKGKAKAGSKGKSGGSSKGGSSKSGGSHSSSSKSSGSKSSGSHSSGSSSSKSSSSKSVPKTSTTKTPATKAKTSTTKTTTKKTSPTPVKLAPVGSRTPTPPKSGGKTRPVRASGGMEGAVVIVAARTEEAR